MNMNQLDRLMLGTGLSLANAAITNTVRREWDDAAIRTLAESSSPWTPAYRMAHWNTHSLACYSLHAPPRPSGVVIPDHSARRIAAAQAKRERKAARKAQS